MNVTVSLGAVHETGHAVVAAYLHHSFSHVTLKDGGYVRYRYKQPARLNAEKLADRAVVVLGARAAVDHFFGHLPPEDKDKIEQSYKIDEGVIREIARSMPEDNFREWRDAVLKQAREIVAEPFVTSAITTVAIDLQAAFENGRGLSAKHVRYVLTRFEREAQSGPGE
jgi:hypothetical protein